MGTIPDTIGRKGSKKTCKTLVMSRDKTSREPKIPRPKTPIDGTKMVHRLNGKYICTIYIEEITYNTYIQQQKGGHKEHRVHDKAHMGIQTAQKPHTLQQRFASRKPSTEEAPPKHSGRLHQGPRSYKSGKEWRTCSEVVGEKRVSWCPEPIG